jgi:hypothetical protein
MKRTYLDYIIVIVLGLMLVVVMTACGTSDPFIQKEVVVQHDYVVRKASSQQKLIPPYPTPIDPATATQSDLAQWIIDTEQRQYNLESIIRRLVQFYEMPATAEERAALNPAPAASAASK